MILLSDPRVAAVPVRECGEALVRLSPAFGPARSLVREGLATRLERARRALPLGTGLLVVEGQRTVGDQRSIIARYEREVRLAHPDAPEPEVRRLTSRFVSPIDATPEQSEGRCFTGASGLDAEVRTRRELMGRTLASAGLVNYQTEWWHWSFGDRYWALRTGAPVAIYGPVDVAVAA